MQRMIINKIRLAVYHWREMQEGLGRGSQGLQFYLSFIIMCMDMEVLYIRYTFVYQKL